MTLNYVMVCTYEEKLQFKLLIPVNIIHITNHTLFSINFELKQQMKM